MRAKMRRLGLGRHGPCPLAMVLPDGQVETVSGLEISMSCQLLLEKGAKINIKDRQGRTPLQIAEKNRNTEIAELLRKHGAREGQ